MSTVLDHPTTQYHQDVRVRRYKPLVGRSSKTLIWPRRSAKTTARRCVRRWSIMA